MSDETSATTQAPPTPPTPPLDEVMLAMDVVDTLRAQRSLVEAELNEEGRAQAFADRVKSIYASQGIDVPDSVIAEAVQALEQDRFTYEPPARSSRVRLAEIYIDRAVWFRRLAAALVVAALIWGGIAWSRHRRNRGLIEGFSTRQSLLERDVTTTQEQIDALSRRLAAAGRTSGTDKVTSGLVTEAERLLAATRERAQALEVTAPIDANAYPDDQRALDARLETRRRAITDVQSDLSRVEGQLDVVRRLQGLRGRITMALAKAAGVAVPDAQRAELERLKTQAMAALEAGDVETAEARVTGLRSAVASLVQTAALKQHVLDSLRAAEADLGNMRIEADVQAEAAELGSRIRALLEAGDADAASARLAELQLLTQVLGLAYELRIISRPGEKSGIWRYPEDRPNVRNHYIVVEPLGPDGRAMSIPVRNEEDQIVRTVKRFAVRVPEAVYEAVKADKVDNGIVDNSLFGVKKRGTRSPAYRFDVAGGWITDW